MEGNKMQEKEGFIALTDTYRFCFFCKYLDETIDCSNSGPLRHYRCKHPQWEESRMIGAESRTPKWCPFIPKPEETENLITEEWLKSKGFRLVGERGDERTKPEIRLRRLAICGKGGTKNLFSSPDDLCIDIAPNPIMGDWYVWLHQEEPYQFIHVRQFRYQNDLQRLYEALTGIPIDYP